MPKNLVPNLPKPPATPQPAFPVPPPKLPSLPGHPGLHIPPGGMPPLPKQPWVAARNPSAHLVQKQFVATRLDELGANRMPGRQAALDILEEMLLERSQKKHKSVPRKELLRVYDAIERNLQSAELTVNFNCETWFTNENPYDTYTQMYQRAIEGDTMVLRDTPQNQADVRAMADNQVTFPKSWQGREAPRHRGLRPGRQSPDRIQSQMDTGDLVDVTGPGELRAFLAGNPHFNPHTKQVFLALNYGRRPRGSAVNYGYSHFVVNGKLKANCLYFAQDTFFQARQGVDAGAIQVPYSNLGALLEANGSQHLRDAIFESCYEGRILPDVGTHEGLDTSLCKFYLVEAHHFGELSFREHVDYMVISPKDVPDRDAWPTIVANAREFADRNELRLFQTD